MSCSTGAGVRFRSSCIRAGVASRADWVDACDGGGDRHRARRGRRRPCPAGAGYSLSASTIRRHPHEPREGSSKEGGDCDDADNGGERGEHPRLGASRRATIQAPVTRTASMARWPVAPPGRCRSRFDSLSGVDATRSAMVTTAGTALVRSGRSQRLAPMVQRWERRHVGHAHPDPARARRRLADRHGKDATRQWAGGSYAPRTAASGPTFSSAAPADESEEERGLRDRA